jgi:hypothetical protein
MFRLQQCSARFGPSPFQCCVHYTQQELCSASLGRARRSSRSCVSPWRRWYNPRCFVPCCVADAIWSKTLVKGAPDAILSEVVSFSKLRLRKRSLWRVAQDAKLDFIGENLEEPNLHTRFAHKLQQKLSTHKSKHVWKYHAETVEARIHRRPASRITRRIVPETSANGEYGLLIHV